MVTVFGTIYLGEPGERGETQRKYVQPCIVDIVEKLDRERSPSSPTTQEVFH